MLAFMVWLVFCGFITGFVTCAILWGREVNLDWGSKKKSDGKQ